jgi:hypothetical protein
MGYNLI